MGAAIWRRCSRTVQRDHAEIQIAQLNAALPHYRQIRAFHIEAQPLTIESGLLKPLTASCAGTQSPRGSREEIEAMYQKAAR